MKRKQQIFAAAIAVLFLLVLGGCGAPPSGVSYNGNTMTADLETNASTGYLWHYEIADEAVISYVSDSYESYNDEENVVGVGGVQTFVFEGAAKGKTLITLTNKQSWEGGDTAETIVMQVKVNRDGSIDYVKEK